MSKDKRRDLLNNRRANLTGFTLIELLIVVVVIGILAGMVFVVISDIQTDARNFRRKSDMRTIANAMEMDRVEARGGLGYHQITVDAGTPARVTNTAIGPHLAPLPKDPNDTAYFGIASSAGHFYFCVWAVLEPANAGVVAASEKGAREMANAPTSLADCP